jgi:hypothetical protein
MTYREWRKRTAGVLEATLLKRAHEILQEWNNLDEQQAQDILDQFTSRNKEDKCWEETLPSITMNFTNWGI